MSKEFCTQISSRAHPFNFANLETIEFNFRANYSRERDRDRERDQLSFKDQIALLRVLELLKILSRSRVRDVVKMNLTAP